MNFIPMQVLEYRFDDEGITQLIVVAFQHYQGNENFNARVSLTEEFVNEQNPNLTLDSLTKEQVETFARRKVREWIMVSRPEPGEEPEVEEEPVVEE